MLDDLKKLFSQAWASFLDEVGRREPEDQVAGLLGAMRREMVEVRAQLPLLEQNYNAAVAELERERARLDVTTRRRGQAERIADAETVRVATEFEEKHRRRVAVLEDKVRAARAEWELRRDEAQEMMTRYKEADGNRFVLLSELRRQGARGRIDGTRPGGGSPLDDFARAEEKIEDDVAYADALDELSDVPPPPRRPAPEDVDDRLAELKRRMGM
jgi:phage shock protein A